MVICNIYKSFVVFDDNNGHSKGNVLILGSRDESIRPQLGGGGGSLFWPCSNGTLTTTQDSLASPMVLGVSLNYLIVLWAAICVNPKYRHTYD